MLAQERPFVNVYQNPLETLLSPLSFEMTQLRSDVLHSSWSISLIMWSIRPIIKVFKQRPNTLSVVPYHRDEGDERGRAFLQHSVLHRVSDTRFFAFPIFNVYSMLRGTFLECWVERYNMDGRSAGYSTDRGFCVDYPSTQYQDSGPMLRRWSTSTLIGSIFLKGFGTHVIWGGCHLFCFGSR